MPPSLILPAAARCFRRVLSAVRERGEGYCAPPEISRSSRCRSCIIRSAPSTPSRLFRVWLMLLNDALMSFCVVERAVGEISCFSVDRIKRNNLLSSADKFANFAFVDRKLSRLSVDASLEFETEFKYFASKATICSVTASQIWNTPLIARFASAWASRLRTHKLSFQANAAMIQSLVMEALNERRTFLAERRAVFAA